METVVNTVQKVQWYDRSSKIENKNEKAQMTNHGQEAQTGFDAYLCSVRTSVIQLSGTNEKTLIWGCSSAGRAPALQAGGQGFDSLHLHHRHAPEANSGKVDQSERPSHDGTGSRSQRNRVSQTNGVEWNQMSQERSVAQVVRARA